jgi:YD repeat-containing protein
LPATFLCKDEIVTVGNRINLTYPDGWNVDFAYDALSRRQSVSYGNGASVSFGYTDRGDLTDHDLAFVGAGAAN